MATKANLVLETKKTDFLKTLEKSLESVEGLGKETPKVNKSFETFNKTTKDSEKLLKGMAKSSTELAEGFTGFVKSAGSFQKQTKDNAESLIELNDNLDEATTGLSGFGLRLAGVKGPLEQINNVLGEPAGHLRDIADASNNTERAFIILDKAKKPLIKGLQLLGKTTRKASNFFRSFENTVSVGSAKALKIGATAINGLSNAFGSLQERFKSKGLVGRVISNQLGTFTEGLDEAEKSTRKLSNSLEPKNFKKADEIGNILSISLSKSDKLLKRIQIGVGLADLTGDIYRAGLAVKDFAEESLAPIAPIMSQIGTQLFGFSGNLNTVESKLGLVAKAARTANIFLKKEFLTTISTVSLKLAGFIGTIKTFASLGQTLVDVATQATGVNTSFEVFKSLGINTYAAETVLQFGLIGEKLLFNAEASREFGKAAVTSFAQFQDQAAFVTTLNAGLEASFKGYEKGIQSISEATKELVNGPLKNSITSGEAATSMYNALSAGIGVARDGTAKLSGTLAFMESALKLSAATATDASQSVEVLSKVNKIYGRSNQETAKTAAQLYGIVQEGITTFPQLAGGLGRTASQAKASGVSLEEMNGSVAALTKIMSTDEVLTGYSGLLRAIAGQGEGSAKAVQELGIKFDAQTVKSKGLIAALQDLQKATNGNQTTLKRIIPDSLAFTTALNLMTTAGEDATNIMGNIEKTGENAGEELDKLFGNRQQTLIKRSTNLMNGFSEVLVEFGEKALPLLNPGLVVLESILAKIQEMPDFLKTAIGALILTQSLLNQVVGAGAGLVGFFAKLALSMITTNLLMKTLNGTIKDELEAVKQLALVEDDYLGALTRLMGKNKKAADSTVLLTRARQSQIKVGKQLQEAFKSNGLVNPGDIKILDGIVESYEDGVTYVKKLRKELNESGASFATPEIYKDQLKELDKLEAALKSAAKNTFNAQKRGLSELQGNIKKSLVQTTKTIDERKDDVRRAVDDVFVVFGDVGENLKNSVSADIEKVLADTTLTTRQQGEKLAAVISGIPTENAPKLKKSLSRVAGIYQDSFNAIELSQKEFVKTTETNFDRVLLAANLPTGGKLQSEFKELFNGLDMTVEERSKLLQKKFNQILAQSPKLGAQQGAVKAAINELLDSAEEPFVKRSQVFRKRMKTALEGVDQEGRNYAGVLASTMFQVVQGMETPLKEFNLTATAEVNSILDNMKVAFSNFDFGNTDLNKLRDVVGAELDRTDITAKEKLETINESISQLAQGSDLETKEKLFRLRDNLEEQLGLAVSLSKEKVASVNAALKELGQGPLETITGSFDDITMNAQVRLAELELKVKSGISNMVDQGKVEVKKLNSVLETIATDENGKIVGGMEKLTTAMSSELVAAMLEGKITAKELEEGLSAIGTVRIGEEKFKAFFSNFKETVATTVETTTEDIKRIYKILQGDFGLKELDEIDEKLSKMGGKAPEKLRAQLAEYRQVIEAEGERIVNSSEQSLKASFAPEFIKPQLEEIQVSLKQTASVAENTTKFLEKTEKAAKNANTQVKSGLGDIKSGLNGLITSAGQSLGLPMGEIRDLTEIAKGLGIEASKSSQKILTLEEANDALNVTVVKQTKSLKESIKGFQATRKAKGLNAAINGVLSSSLLGVAGGQAASTVTTGLDTPVTAANAVVKGAHSKVVDKDTVSLGGHTNAQYLDTAATAKDTVVTGKLAGAKAFLGNAFKGLAAKTAALRAGLAKLSGGFLTLLKKTLVPIIAKLALLAGAFVLIKRLVLDNIPGVNLLTDSYARLGRQTKKTAEDLRELNDELKKGKLEQKEFVQGARGAILNAGETLYGAAVRGAGKIAFASEEDLDAEAQMIRRWFNGFRKNLQADIRRNAIDGVRELDIESRKIVENSKKISDKQSQGAVSTVASKEILENAKALNKTLTGSELSEILKLERDAMFEQREALEALLLAREDDLKAAKKAGDPVIIEMMEKMTLEIENQLGVLELSNKEFAKYANNLQTFASTLQINDAAKNLDKFKESTQNLINSDEFQKLAPELQKAFLDIKDIKVDSVDIEDTTLLNAAGFSDEAIKALKDKGAESVNVLAEIDSNLVNAVQLRSSAKSNVAISTAASLANNITNTVEEGITTLDTAQVQIEDALSAIEEDAAEGIFSAEDAVIKKDMVLDMEFDIPEDTPEEVKLLLKDFKDKTLRDILSITGSAALFDQEIENVKKATGRIIAQKTRELDQINALAKSGSITQLELAKETARIQAEIREANAKDVEKRLEKTRKLYTDDSKQTKDILREQTALQQSSDSQIIDSAKAVSKARINERNQEVKIIESRIKDTQRLEEKGEITRVESLNRQIEEQTRIDEVTLANKKDYLATLLKNVEANSEEVKQVTLDLANFQNEVDLRRFKERKNLLEEEIKLTKSKYQLEVELAKQSQIEISNIQSLRQKTLQQDKAVMDSQLALNNAFSNFETTIRQNRIKLTADIEEKAQIDLQIAKDRQVLLNRELEAEEKNIVLQQEITELGFAREKSQLRMNKLESESLSFELEMKLARKEELGLKEDEIALLEVQVETQKLQREFLTDQEAQLETTILQQDEINDRQIKAFQLQKQAKVDSAAVDAELAARDAVIAKYEKQKKQVILTNEIQAIGNQRRIQGLQQQSDLLQSQADLIAKQKDLVEGITSSIQQAFNIAVQSEKNEFRKRRLQKEAAQVQLETLRRQQEFEKISYDLQVQQKDLALQRQRIEIEINKAKGEADLAVARAEEQQSLADPTKTALEREAATARVRAQELTLSGLEQQSKLIEQQTILEQSTREAERSQFERSQRNALFSQEAAVAATTLRRSDDRDVSRRAIESARADAKKIPELVKTFSSNLETLSLSKPFQELANNTAVTPPSPELKGEVNINLNLAVDGDASNLDQEQLNKTVTEHVAGGLTDFFENLRVRSKV